MKMNRGSDLGVFGLIDVSIAHLQEEAARLLEPFEERDHLRHVVPDPLVATYESQVRVRQEGFRRRERKKHRASPEERLVVRAVGFRNVVENRSEQLAFSARPLDKRFWPIVRGQRHDVGLRRHDRFAELRVGLRFSGRGLTHLCLAGPSRTQGRPALLTAPRPLQDWEGDSQNLSRISVLVARENVPPVASGLPPLAGPFPHGRLDLDHDIFVSVGTEPGSNVVLPLHPAARARRQWKTRLQRSCDAIVVTACVYLGKPYIPTRVSLVDDGHEKQ